MINLRGFKTVKKTREGLEKALGVSLQNIGHYSSDVEIASTRNCENMIGVAQIPMGVAGPLKISNLKFKISNFYVPLATTEGALIASVNRGCKAITQAGGANVFLEKIGITRGPVFKTNSLEESFKLRDWLLSHLSYLDHLGQKTSSHLKLLKIEPQVLGRNVYVRFYFETQEAMGMNMATIATDSVIQIIERKTKARCVSVSGNFCVDKKPSWLNFICGRGRKIWAEAEISKDIVKEVLKTTPEKIYEVWLNKCLLGSALSGSMGFNAHFGNIVAAIFAATGQDLAHVTEGSLGITTVEIEKIKNKKTQSKIATPDEYQDEKRNGGDNLYISVYLPDLPLGVVGGGTGLATQKEALSIIFGQEKPSVDVFAGVIAGAVLAGELSLLASLAEGSLAKAHGAHRSLGEGGT